jgi:hypothetical protein
MARSAKARGAAAAQVRSDLVSESELHRVVADFLNWVMLPPAIWTTFPAGWGKLGKATAGRLKASGLKEGFPDILLFYDGHAFGIELKTRKGKPTPVQLEMFNSLNYAGVQVHICRRLEEVRDVLVRYKIPMRKHDGLETSEIRCPSQPDAGAPQTP